MSKRVTLAISLGCLVSSCVKEISNEERLERDLKRVDASQTESAEQLVKLKCDDIGLELAKAKDDSAPEDRRLNTYVELYDKVRDRTRRFEEAITRNPDLAYQEGSEEVIGARDGCIQSQADVRYDFERLVREIVALPVVDDIRDGRPVKAARLNFETLREALEKLDPDDKETMLNRLANAEKTVEVREPKKKK